MVEQSQHSEVLPFVVPPSSGRHCAVDLLCSSSRNCLKAERRRKSRQYVVQHSRLFDAGQACIQPQVLDAEAFVIDAQQAQHRGVQISDGASNVSKTNVGVTCCMIWTAATRFAVFQESSCASRVPLVASRVKKRRLWMSQSKSELSG